MTTKTQKNVNATGRTQHKKINSGRAKTGQGTKMLDLRDSRMLDLQDLRTDHQDTKTPDLRDLRRDRQDTKTLDLRDSMRGHRGSKSSNRTVAKGTASTDLGTNIKLHRRHGRTTRINVISLEVMTEDLRGGILTLFKVIFHDLVRTLAGIMIIIRRVIGRKTK